MNSGSQTTKTIIEAQAPKRLADANIQPRGRVFESPNKWRDQVLYFLLPDRFSDGKENERPLFKADELGYFKAKNKKAWMAAGLDYNGGTLKGIESKLTYLKNLGITTIWIAPVLKQRKDLHTYHGYGIQNFLEVDPHFGTRQDLRDLVDAAHDLGMYVLLDIIYNHAGNNWFYADPNDSGRAKETLPYTFGEPHPFHSWRSEEGKCIATIKTLDDGIWPEEFQNPDCFTRAGQIGWWDPKDWENPLHPDAEFRRGDFFNMKDINANDPQVLTALVKVYQYWIALSDCDGFRIDAVKHVPWEVSRRFCGAIREYTESIGKENFLMLGEVAGGNEMAKSYLEVSGRNIDAVLDIGEPSRRLINMVKGLGDPSEFFNQYKDLDILGSHRETGRYHVSILDDHDMIAGEKSRFAHDIEDSPFKYQQIAHAVGVQLTTLGIPCIYYGTEQALDGTEKRHDSLIEPLEIDGRIPEIDRYIRECIFGGPFGAFETECCHFFDEKHPTYVRIAAIARLRNNMNKVGLTLRRGRQYLRETLHEDGKTLEDKENDPAPRSFALPKQGDIVAWSRICFDQEVLIAINTNTNKSQKAQVSMDLSLHGEGGRLKFLYRGDWTEEQLRKPPDQYLTINPIDGRMAVQISLSPGEMVILG